MSTTSGHCANSMGVRGHSAGDVFPAVIYLKGCFTEGFTYHILNHPKCEEGYGYCNYYAAYMTALCTPRHF